MIFPYFIATIFLIISLAGIVSGQANLLENPGFEDENATGTPINWSLSSSDGPIGDSMALDTEVKHGGDKSLRIRQSDENLFSIASQDVIVEENQEYTLTGFARLADVLGGGVGARIFITDSSSTEELGHVDITGLDWEEVKVQFNSNSHSKIRVRCYLHKVAGTVWFDDLTLEKE